MSQELNANFKEALQNLKQYGLEVSPRGSKTLELINYNITLTDPRNRIVNFKDRNTNLKYLLGEFIWYLSGDPSPDRIVPYSYFWDKLRDKEGNVNSNYGAYLFGVDEDCIVNYNDANPHMTQFGLVVETLKNDVNSRQAIVNIHLPKHRVEGSKDVCCTIYLQFLIRQNKLHMITAMRSNDIIRGWTNDVFQFTMIQECVLCQLKKVYPELELGLYCHNAGSFHIYDLHFPMMDKILADENVLDVSMIPMDAFTCDMMRALIEVFEQYDPKNPDVAVLESDAFSELTPYWQNLIKMCFFDDEDAFHFMHEHKD